MKIAESILPNFYYAQNLYGSIILEALDLAQKERKGKVLDVDIDVFLS